MADVNVGAIVEPDPRFVAPHSELIGKIPIKSTYQEFLRSDLMDAAIICSANNKHRQMVIDIARAGIPILCEKPLASRTQDAREMLAICEAHDTTLGICFPCRFSELLRQAKHMIKQGALGEIVAVKALNRGTMPGGWFVDPALSGGGAIVDHTVHVVDALRWLFDCEFVRVHAFASTRLHDIPVEDTAVLSLEMNNGVFVSLDASWSRPDHSFPIWGDVQMDIIGTNGILNLDLFPWTLNFFSEASGKHVAVSQDGDLNRRMLENFIQSIHDEKPFVPDGLDGLRALEVVEAAYRSVRTGQVVLL
jgi:predicted dehydrogenase